MGAGEEGCYFSTPPPFREGAGRGGGHLHDPLSLRPVNTFLRGVYVRECVLLLFWRGYSG